VQIDFSVLQVLFAIFFILNYFVMFGITEGIFRLIFKKKESTVHYLISFAIIFFPMVIYLIIRTIFFMTGLLEDSVFAVIDVILLIFFQVWSLWLLTYNINMIKAVRLEYGIIVALLLHYAAFSVILLISI